MARNGNYLKARTLLTELRVISGSVLVASYDGSQTTWPVQQKEKEGWEKRWQEGRKEGEKEEVILISSAFFFGAYCPAHCQYVNKHIYSANCDFYV